MPALVDFPDWFLFAFAVPFGLCWGSFLNVLIHRLPIGESPVWPASRCPACGAPIRPSDNVPLVSFLRLRGKARCCGARISVRYPLVELLGGVLAAAVVQVIVLELPPETFALRALAIFLVYLGLGLLLTALTFIDLEHMLLPDSLTFGGALLGLVSVSLRGMSLVDALIGGAIGFLIIYLPFDLGHRLLRGYPGMGLGDAKLTLLAGAWFGWQGAAFALFAGAIQATCVTLAVYAARGRIDEPEAVVAERRAFREALGEAKGDEKRELERELELDPVLAAPASGLGKARVPFGPFLALATLEYALLEPGLRPLFDAVLFTST